MKAVFLGLALSILGLGGIGATDAHARDERARDFSGVWRLDDGRGGWHDDHADGREGYGDQGSYGDRSDDARSYGRGWNGNGGGDRSIARRLPEVLRIEKARRAFRIEDSRGNLLRSVETSRRWNSDRLQIERTGPGGRRIVETFSLDNRGRRLVVLTRTQGPQGWREFTQVYERA